MNEIAALFLSFGFVFAIIGIATFLLSFDFVSGEVSRKVIHIGVSNWWLIAMNFMEQAHIAVIGPISFIIINTISYKQHLFPAMEDDVPRDNLGTIYFPISLLVLVLLCFNGYLPLSAGAAGILIMGYGDGLAALVGSHFGRYRIKLGPWNTRKTLLGSSTMLITSFITVLLILSLSPAEGLATGPINIRGISAPGFSGVAGVSILVAMGATLIELVTPRGFDNITVPILSAFLFTATGGLLL